MMKVEKSTTMVKRKQLLPQPRMMLLILSFHLVQNQRSCSHLLRWGIMISYLGMKRYKLKSVIHVAIILNILYILLKALRQQYESYSNKSKNKKKLKRLKFFSVYIIPGILMGKIKIIKSSYDTFFQDSALSTFLLESGTHFKLSNNNKI